MFWWRFVGLNRRRHLFRFGAAFNVGLRGYWRSIGGRSGHDLGCIHATGGGNVAFGWNGGVCRFALSGWSLTGAVFGV
jgi:hypothetical protein